MTDLPILGIFGGGQLGQMFSFAAQQMGFEVCVFCPESREDSPAARISQHHIQADYLDYAALDTFSDMCTAASTEFENVPAESLEYLSKRGLWMAPTAYAVHIAQNRIREKNFFFKHDIPTTPFYILEKDEDIEVIASHANDFPFILKTASMGYDGKGQIKVNHMDELRQAWLELHKVPCVLERFMMFDHEISVILARNHKGEIVFYPVAHNTHRNGILHYTQVPSQKTSEDSKQQALYFAEKTAKLLDYRGVLCIEFFVTPDQKVWVNEMAPRPHNSGHFTQSACLTSQFEQQVRVLANYPLGDTALRAENAAMINILGDDCLKENDAWNNLSTWQKLLTHTMDLRWYHKNPPRVGRKMGHINIVGKALHVQKDLHVLLQHL